MKAIWGLFNCAAVVLMGCIGWTYTVELKGVGFLTPLLFVLEFVFAGFMLLVFMPHSGYFGGGFRIRPAILSVSKDHWRAWRRRMPVRVVRTSVVMVTASFVLAVAYLVLTKVESKEQVFSANGLRFLLAAGALLLSLAAVLLTAAFSLPGAGTSRTTGRP